MFVTKIIVRYSADFTAAFHFSMISSMTKMAKKSGLNIIPNLANCAINPPFTAVMVAISNGKFIHYDTQAVDG
ncbi:hypothetical protein A4G99_01275 [Haladaptatus sp. R4]|nr:hypothetical protein A4G99_01275 [Haladaptatus sp. R4]